MANGGNISGSDLSPREMIYRAVELRQTGQLDEARALGADALEAEFERSANGPHGRLSSEYYRRPILRHTLDFFPGSSTPEFFDVTGRGGRLWGLALLEADSASTPSALMARLEVNGWSPELRDDGAGAIQIEIDDGVILTLQWSTEDDVIHAVRERHGRIHWSSHRLIPPVPNDPAAVIIFATFGDAGTDNAIACQGELIGQLAELDETIFLQNGSAIHGDSIAIKFTEEPNGPPLKSHIEKALRRRIHPALKDLGANDIGQRRYAWSNEQLGFFAVVHLGLDHPAIDGTLAVYYRSLLEAEVLSKWTNKHGNFRPKAKLLSGTQMAFAFLAPVCVERCWRCNLGEPTEFHRSLTLHSPGADGVEELAERVEQAIVQQLVPIIRNYEDPVRYLERVALGDTDVLPNAFAMRHLFPDRWRTMAHLLDRTDLLDAIESVVALGDFT